MNPRAFYESIVKKDPQEFIDETYKILIYMGLATSDKDELSTYQLKDVAQTWYIQLRDNRILSGGLFTWDDFKKAFVDYLFPREKKESKLEEFISLCQDYKHE